MKTVAPTPVSNKQRYIVAATDGLDLDFEDYQVDNLRECIELYTSGDNQLCTAICNQILEHEGADIVRYYGPENRDGDTLIVAFKLIK